MYRVTTKKQNGEEQEISRSNNHRLAKRKARWYAAGDPSTWFSMFRMYEDDELQEEGAVIKSRISWKKINNE